MFNIPCIYKNLFNDGHQTMKIILWNAANQSSKIKTNTSIWSRLLRVFFFFFFFNFSSILNSFHVGMVIAKNYRNSSEVQLKNCRHKQHQYTSTHVHDRTLPWLGTCMKGTAFYWTNTEKIIMPISNNNLLIRQIRWLSTVILIVGMVGLVNRHIYFAVDYQSVQ